jgi:hypothetical protein
MRDSDLVAFVDTFTRMRRIFPAFKGNQRDTQDTAEEYFRLLMPFPLRAVDAGADAWISKGEHFPKPAQWIACIPRAQASAYPTMVDPDASEHRRAVQLWYEDQPCGCHECRTAEVSHRMLRYVPDEDRDGNDARMVLDGRVVVKGRWIHGADLKRWYEARDRFLAIKDDKPGRFPRRMKKATQAQLEAEAHRMGMELTNELPAEKL